MNKTIILLLPFFLNHACKTETETKKNHIPDSRDFFSNCFLEIDTSFVGYTIGCTAGFYKIINEKYVIRIASDFTVGISNCDTIIIDSTNAYKIAELLLFDDANANLTNVCSDIHVVNAPDPTRHLTAHSGKIIVGLSDEVWNNSRGTHLTTILIKNLVFVDAKTGERIEIENELLWKVANLGTPG